jgi:hypothetical protein
MSKRPVSVFPGAGIQAPERGVAHPASSAVGPIEAPFFQIPYRPFAEMIAALEETFDSNRHAIAAGIVSRW